MQAAHNGTQDESEWWSVEEVADYFRVSRETVRRWVRGGKLRASKPGRGKTSPLRIQQVDVDEAANFRPANQPGERRGEQPAAPHPSR